ncbi:ABC transporter permease/substrate-binding protein [Clostridium senegalense]|uniref:ABC transporter permease subunit n=1 Tax=Clostridium senegalense TaxID=1465809 RepID=A0A6M0H113_9CLOT|nr:ABC transporter permease/substrate-binding protein [Clostridium senegalense]NEU04470.1 ABC transporter permease subunit [Clostridium senegalense]
MNFIKEVLKLYIHRADFFLELVIQHLVLSFVAVVISTIIGIFLGVIVCENKRLSNPIKGITNFLYTIPSIAILGFLVSFSGVGNITAIITLSLYGLLPIITNTYTGIENVDKDVIEAGKGMGATKRELLYKIKLPLALPVIFAGFRNMVVMTIALCGIASFIGAGGLGVAIWRGITTNNPTMTFAGSLLIALIALTIDSIMSCIQKYINIRFTKGKVKRKVMGTKKHIGVISILLIIIIFIGANFNRKETIIIASKPMTEQYILTEIMAQLIEEKTSIKVEIKKGIGGGTANIHPAIVKGEVDIYPEYTGTSWEYVLKKKSQSENTYEELKKEYKEKYDLNWFNLYGYDSNYAIVVNKELAEKYNLKTYSDLATISDKLVIGAEYDFYEREDGYNSLAKLYNFNFKDTLDLDMGLKYKALTSNKIDVIMASTTDGQLVNENYLVLKDDKRFFPNYLAGTIIREETLKKYPELIEVLNLLNNTITEKEIINMNYKVEVEKKEDFQVAKEFLIEKGIIK